MEGWEHSLGPIPECSNMWRQLEHNLCKGNQNLQVHSILRTSNENCKNLTELYIYKFSNLSSSSLFSTLSYILIYNIKITRATGLWYVELPFQNMVSYICLCKNYMHVSLLWGGGDLGETLVLILVSFLSKKDSSNWMLQYLN